MTLARAAIARPSQKALRSGPEADHCTKIAPPRLSCYIPLDDRSIGSSLADPTAFGGLCVREAHFGQCPLLPELRVQ